VDQAWVDALDGLEADIAAAEQLLDLGELAEVAPWTPPVLTTPLPAELGDRARDLHDRQAAVLAAVDEATTRSQRQLTVTDRIGWATRRPTTRSVYVDTSA